MPPKTQAFRALYAFEVGEPDELEIMAGDIIDVAVVHAGMYVLMSSRIRTYYVQVHTLLGIIESNIRSTNKSTSYSLL